MSSKFIAVVFVFLSVTQSWGQEIDQPIERVFSVEGYDSNDVVQVMVQGTFKNPCVKLGTMSSIVDVDSRIIELHITSFEPDSTESKPCRLGHVSVPFNSLIYLGQLREPGDYKLVDLTTKKSVGRLVILKAPASESGTDNVDYVPLYDAYLVQKRSHTFLHLEGALPNSCLELGKVELRVQKDALVALPAMNLIERAGCQNGNFLFRKTFAIAHPLPQSPFLLHVRTSGGQAIQKVVHLLGAKKV